MDCQTALLIYLIILFIVFIYSIYGACINAKSALALSLLISILILSLLKPLNASRVVKSDGYAQLFAILYLITSIYLLWYILYMSYNDTCKNL